MKLGASIINYIAILIERVYWHQKRFFVTFLPLWAKK